MKEKNKKNNKKKKTEGTNMNSERQSMKINNETI